MGRSREMPDMSKQILKWGDKGKMVCASCEHFGVFFDYNGHGPFARCEKGNNHFRPYASGGGRGCPEWEMRIEIPEDQEIQ
jgi:hypothetical protein